MAGIRLGGLRGVHRTGDAGERARTDIEAQGLGGYVTWFTGRPVEPADVSHWWDIGLLLNLYRAFVCRWGSIALGAASQTHGRKAFADYLQLVDDWRQFPRVDPGLPAALLPKDWLGRQAFDIFSGLSEPWAAAADRFVLNRPVVLNQAAPSLLSSQSPTRTRATVGSDTLSWCDYPGGSEFESDW